MLDAYKIKNVTEKLELDIELEVIKALHRMHGHTKLTPSEIVNTALKRFIAAHKDFLPGEKLGG